MSLFIFPWELCYLFLPSNAIKSIVMHKSFLVGARIRTEHDAPLSFLTPKGNKGHWSKHIDGLRAIAVLSVLFYHANVFNVPGGFVGVDVFFVISGFLISRIIYDEIKSHGKLRVVDFYERRARRILPVFVVVTGAVIVAGYFLLLPNEFADLGRSATYASVFAANVFFYHETAYFGGFAITMPLLHYWSLGVEEQFYIVFPLIAFAIGRVAPKLLGVVVLSILGASLALAEHYIGIDPKTAFYLAPPRAWELMVGSVLALPSFPHLTRRALREMISLVGLAFIIFAVFKFDATTRFPGISASIPVFGSALILWACERGSTFVGALLSVRPLRSVGLWSYSIYMIHWPIVAFARVLLPQGFHGIGFVIVVISIGLGCASYVLVEMPFRKPRQILGRFVLFAASFASLSLLFMTGILVFWNQGFPDRLPSSVQKVLKYDNLDVTSLYRVGKCFIGTDGGWQDLDTGCLFDSRRPSVLLWGDSHAAHLYAALRDLFPDVVILQATLAACAPIVGLVRVDIPHCAKFNDEVLRWAQAKKPDAVILSAEWPRDSDLYSKLDDQLMLLRLANIPVTIVGETPFYIDPVPKILARRMLKEDYGTRAEDDGIGAPYWGDYYMKARYTNLPGVRYISSRDNFCVDRECPLMTEAGVPIYSDRDHFTQEGAMLVVSRMFRDGIFMKGAR